MKKKLLVLSSLYILGCSNDVRMGKIDQICYPNKTCNESLECIDNRCLKVEENDHEKSIIIDVGNRVISLEANDQIVHFVKENSHIDILCISENKTKEKIVVPILENITVVRVEHIDNKDFFIIYVTPAEAEILFLYQKTSSIHYILRNPEDLSLLEGYQEVTVKNILDSNLKVKKSKKNNPNLTKKDATNIFTEKSIKKGFRAISLKANLAMRSWINRGDRVDIIALLKDPKTNNYVSKILIENVEVLDKIESKDKKNIELIISLWADNIKYLVLAQEIGELRFAQRDKDDKTLNSHSITYGDSYDDSRLVEKILRPRTRGVMIKSKKDETKKEGNKIEILAPSNDN